MFERLVGTAVAAPPHAAIGVVPDQLCALSEEEEALVEQALAELDAQCPLVATVPVQADWIEADRIEADCVEAAPVETDWVTVGGASTAPVPLPEIPPGAELAARVAALDPSSVDDVTCVDLIDAAARLGAWAEAVSISAIAGLCRARPPLLVEPGRARWSQSACANGVSEYVIEEMAAALYLSRNAATDRVLAALDLTRRLPSVLNALRSGAISPARARAFAEETRLVTAQTATAVADALLPTAARLSVSQLRRRLATEVLAHDPAGAASRADAATRAHRVMIRDEGNGLASITTYASPAEATAVFTVLDLRAKAMARRDDGLSADQRRAHALIDLVLTHPWITGDATGTTGPARSSVLACHGARTDPHGRGRSTWRHRRIRPSRC